MLLIGLGFVLCHAVGRLSDPQEVRVPGMLVLAILGIAFNGAAVLRMKGGSSLTEKLVSWHLIEDTLGWFAVLVGAGIMMIWNVPIVDPILSIGISLIVLWNVGRNLKKSFPSCFKPFRKAAILTSSSAVLSGSMASIQSTTFIAGPSRRIARAFAY